MITQEKSETSKIMGARPLCVFFFWLSERNMNHYLQSNISLFCVLNTAVSSRRPWPSSNRGSEPLSRRTGFELEARCLHQLATLPVSAAVCRTVSRRSGGRSWCTRPSSSEVLNHRDGFVAAVNAGCTRFLTCKGSTCHAFICRSAAPFCSSCRATTHIPF